MNNNLNNKLKIFLNENNIKDLKELKKFIKIENNNINNNNNIKLKNLRNDKIIYKNNNVKFLKQNGNNINYLDTKLISKDINTIKSISGNVLNNNNENISIPNLLLRNINIYFTENYNILFKDLNYIETTNELKENNLLSPLDILQFHSNYLDIGLFCLDIYENNFNLNNSISLTFKDSNSNSIIILGEDFYKNNENPPNRDIKMSTVKDTLGNVYSLKETITFSYLNDFLDNNKIIEPSNKSDYLNNNNFYLKKKFINNNKKERIFKDEISPINCYIKGFLIFNSYSKKLNEENNEYIPDLDKPHTVILYLNQLTLIKFNKNIDRLAINVGDFMNINQIGGNSYSIIFNENDNYYNYLPLKSIFYKSIIEKRLFEGFKFSILSPEIYPEKI